MKPELSPEEKKERIKQQKREWYARNKDKVIAENKKYYSETYRAKLQEFKKFYNLHHQQQPVS